MFTVDQMTAEAVAEVAEMLELRGQQITLTPVAGVVVEKPGGGNDYGPAADRAPQTFALFNSGGFDGREDSQTDQGVSRKFQFTMYGAADAVVQIGDVWEDSSAKYTVESVDVTQPYQVKCVVTAFLKTSGHGFG